MARTARTRLDDRFALLDAPDRNIRNEARRGIAKLCAFEVFRNLDDSLAKWLCSIIGGRVHRSSDARLRRVLRFDHADPLLEGERAEIRGRRLDFFIARRLRILD